MNKKISDDTPSCSQEDKNANLNKGINQNRGAIPKTKHVKTHQNGKESVKMNNNSDKTHIQCSRSISKFNTFSRCFSKDRKKVVRREFDSRNVTVKEMLSAEEGSSSTSSEDNELSVSDDGCIYTYKGDSTDDIPNPLYNIEIPMVDNIEEPDAQRRSNSSPEMDYLEMDFDPGPSGDADSESSASSRNEQDIDHTIDDNRELENEKPTCSKCPNFPEAERESGIKIESLDFSTNHQMKTTSLGYKPVKQEIELPWSCTLSQRTRASKHLRVIKRHMSSSGELTSLKEVITPTPTVSPTNCFKGIVDAQKKSMLWNEHEASLRQFSQIAPSHCGATAVLNALSALRLEIPQLEMIRDCVTTKLRSNSSPLTKYLLSRSEAGCSHREIIEGLKKLSKGRVYARFFSMYPERLVNLHDWLGFWIRHDAVPIATLNIQKSAGLLPDSWHHQMIFGVDSTNVYLTNPIECVDGSELWHQLVSESVLLIKREDVLSRWNPKTDIVQLEKVQDKKWKDLNVLGQVAKVVREQRRASRDNTTVTTHIKIPAVYKSGITIAIDRNSKAFQLLKECPELPLLNVSNAEVTS